jgi:hypothetical protein
MVNALDAMTMAFSNAASEESSGAVLSAMARYGERSLALFLGYDCRCFFVTHIASP